MSLPELLSAALTGLFMGWLMGVIWQSRWVARPVQIAVGLIGGLLAYWVYVASFEFPLGWLGALSLAAVGAMGLSILINLGALLAGATPEPVPAQPADSD